MASLTFNYGFQVWDYWFASPERVQLVLLQKIRDSRFLQKVKFWHRGELITKNIHKLWPSGPAPPGPSEPFKMLLRKLDSRRGGDSGRFLTEWDFDLEPLLLCLFARQPDDIQMEVLDALDVALSKRVFAKMRTAERLAWFERKLRAISAEPEPEPEEHEQPDFPTVAPLEDTRCVSFYIFVVVFI